jgi:hypothetical protein
MPILQPRTYFAQHKVLRLVATGNVAELYEVLAADGGRKALKVLDQELPLASKPQARLGQEAEAISMIDHVNVVRYHATGVEEGRVWLLEELVEGRDLRPQVGEGLLRERVVLHRRTLGARGHDLVERDRTLGQLVVAQRRVPHRQIRWIHDDLACLSRYGRAHDGPTGSPARPGVPSGDSLA